MAICRHGRVRWANSQLAERTGRCSAQALVGSAFVDLFVDTGSGMPDATSWREVECGLRVANGDPRPVCLRRIELSNPNLCELWVVADRDTREGPFADSDIDKLRDRLEEEVRSRQELLEFVSHELRSPLTLIHGYNRLLLGSSGSTLSNEQRGFLEESTRNCKKMGDFLERLSEDARRGAAPCGAARRELASLQTTVCSALERVAPILEAFDIDVRLRIDSRNSRFQFDPSRIEQVFVNLLENAAKYAGAPGSVEISSCVLERSGERFVEISLSDKGPGIAEKDRERVFESGVRLISGNPGPGSGLGLYISRRIIRAHGGHMSVVGNSDGGSTFVFTLPLRFARDVRKG